MVCVCVCVEGKVWCVCDWTGGGVEGRLDGGRCGGRGWFMCGSGGMVSVGGRFAGGGGGGGGGGSEGMVQCVDGSYM